MIWFKVVLLGLVEGITEFLPISSTGHLVVASRLLRFEGSIGGTFEIFIQLGAVLAVVGFYARDLWAQAKAVLHGAGDRPALAGARRFWLSVFIAFLPAAVIGLLLHDLIKSALFRPEVIAISLILGGILLILVEKQRRATGSVHDELSIRPAQGLAVGAAQVLALVPGVSRSGASIVGGLMVGLDRRTATAFSFYLAMPTLGGATVVDLLTSLDQLGPGDIQRLLLGTAVSLVVAFFSIGWLLRYVSRSTFISFGLYRILVGTLIIGLVITGIL